MGTDAFRDASAAMAKALTLGDENERLKAENTELRAQIEQLTKSREGSKEAKEIRRLINDKNSLTEQLEAMRIANIAAVNRIKAEVKEQLKELSDLKAKRDAGGRDRGVGSINERNDLDSANAQIRRLTAERQGLLEQLVQGCENPDEETNGAAFLRRLVEERDELARAVSELRERHDKVKATKPRGFVTQALDRIFR